jgi:16S rRNA (guanine966-N2)-methyltransferase
MAVEENMDCFTFIKKTFKDFKMENASVIRSDVFGYLKNCRDSIADIIFADPPFDLKNYDTLIDIIFENKLLKNNGVFILEHQSKNHFTGNKYFNEERKYGNVTFSFFSKS